MPLWHLDNLRLLFFSLLNFEVIFYSALVCISCKIGLYCFKYLPFIRRVRPLGVNSSTAYALLVYACRTLNGPSQFRDHLPNVLSFWFMGNMTLHTKSPRLNVLDLTFFSISFSHSLFLSHQDV